MITVSQYIVKYLEEYGIKHCFSVVGGGSMFLVNEFGKSKKIKTVYCQHEQSASIAAEGYSRSNNYKLSVVNVTSGPGGLNCLTGVMGQWTDSVPVLYISGQVKHETTIDAYPLCNLRQLGDQEINITDVVRPLTKYEVILTDPYDIKIELDRLIYEATSGRPGPVWIDIPLNIQSALIEEEKLKSWNNTSKVLSISSSDIDKVTNELVNSKRPLLVLGHGITISNAKQEMFNLVAKLNIPVVTTFNGFDLLPNSNHNWIGRIGTLGSRAGNFAIQNSDLVIFLGTRNNIRQISYDWKNFAKNAKKIIVDIDKFELEKPTIQGDILIKGNVKEFISKLLDRSLPCFDNTWLNWCVERKNKYPLIDNIHKEEKSDGLNPYIFIETLTEKLKDNSIIVAGNGTACVSLFQAGIVKSLNQRFIWNSGCASMGYDIPASIGASIDNNKEVICITGDGSIQMNLQDLQTIKHHKLPIKIFLLNNNGYASIIQTQTNFFGKENITGCNEETGISFPDYKKLAELYDLQYFRIHSNKYFSGIIDSVLAYEGSCLCEVILTKDYIFAPKLSSQKQEDGTLVSQPLENMYPFLSTEELKENIVCD